MTAAFMNGVIRVKLVEIFLINCSNKYSSESPLKDNQNYVT